VFGSIERRFAETKKLETPAPGAYKAELALKKLKNATQTNIQRSSSMFLSESHRIPPPIDNRVPPIGAYDVKNYSLGPRQPTNPILANIKARKGVAFQSNTGRQGGAKRQSEDEKFLGPGYYE